MNGLVLLRTAVRWSVGVVDHTHRLICSRTTAVYSLFRIPTPFPTCPPTFTNACTTPPYHHRRTISGSFAWYSPHTTLHTVLALPCLRSGLQVTLLTVDARYMNVCGHLPLPPTRIFSTKGVGRLPQFSNRAGWTRCGTCGCWVVVTGCFFPPHCQGWSARWTSSCLVVLLPLGFLPHFRAPRPRHFPP